jgi:hypothetical protein
MSCKRESKNVRFFRDTEAYALAKAIEKNDVIQIEKIVKEKPELLEVTNPITGSNALNLALILENYDAFKKLLELGANPNFINPYTQRSILINACNFYWKPKPYSIDLCYIKLLLEKGADPNYAVEKDFINEKGHYQMATSAIHEASGLDLEMLKLLIKYGANPYKKLEQDQATPFIFSLRGFKNKFKIANYFIDSLSVNPQKFVINDKKGAWSIQDYVINEFLKTKLKGDMDEIEKLKQKYPGIEEENQEAWKFIKKLENLGVDFKNYEYKK